MLAHGALRVRYILLALVSAIAVSESVVLGGRVGLQLELGEKIGFSVTAYSRFKLSLEAPSRHNKHLSQSLFLFRPGPEV